MELFKSIIEEYTSFWAVILCLILTLILSLSFGIIFSFIKRNEGFSKDLPFTYAILPVVICGITLAITLIVKDQAASETTSRYERVLVALLAALVMIRFRSSQKTTEELTYIFFLVVIGLIMGMGYISFGLILYFIIFILLIGLYFFKYPLLSKNNLNVKITIPEDLNYEDAFNDIFTNFTKYYQLTKVKTSDMGTMFVLNYEVVMKKDKNIKELIDLLRQRNGNLNIIITMKKYTQVD